MTIKEFTDQTGRQVILSFPPRRIVSLVPSQTELLYDLQLGDRIKGITKFCVHPQFKPGKPLKVGGTKGIDSNAIRSLQPDLIIANKEENVQQQVEALMHDFPVWVSDVTDLGSAVAMIESIGDLTGAQKNARRIIAEIRSCFDTLPVVEPALRVIYLIWKDPLMAAGKGTFIDDLLRRAGYVNIIDDPRYPVVRLDTGTPIQPDLVFLSSEPYPFAEKHIDMFRAIWPDSRIVLVDGEMFSWYGSRLRFVSRYLAGLAARLSKDLGY